MAKGEQKNNERHIIPTEKQQIALDCPCDVIVFGGSRGGGKGGTIDSKVCTPFGFRRLGDLKIGDLITSQVTGGLQRVIAVWDRGVMDMYRVKFIDGGSTICSLDHLWKVKQTCLISKKRKLNGLGQDADWRIWTFEKIKNFFDTKHLRNTDQKPNLLVPLSAPVKFTKSYKVDMRMIDPYTLGLVTGDGCITGSSAYPSFYTTEPELAQAIKDAGYTMYQTRPDGNNYIINDPKFRDGLIKLGLWGNRSETHFIPESYKLSPIETRLALIQGLFDADGTADSRGHVGFTTVSKRLAEDVQWIIRSLGGKATITESPGSYRDENGNVVECQMSYDVYVNTTMNEKLFRLQRKIDRCKEVFNGGVSELHNRIVGYEYVGKKECRCITVDDPGGLYLTDDFIVTHNSACAYIKIIQHASMYGENARLLFLRKSLKELEPNVDEAKKWFAGLAEWKEQKSRFEFNNGAICEFDYLKDDKIDSYQGHAYTLVVYDELGNFASIREFDLMRGNLRSSAGVPCQIFATCNPGGPLHNVIKERFIDVAPPMTPVAEAYDKDGNPASWKVYIPSTLYDNPHLLENDPLYIERLKLVGSPEMVRAWIFGDWSIISGGAFDKIFQRDIHIIRPFRVPPQWRVVEVYDDGLSRPYCASFFAISDGSDFFLPNGERRGTIRGDVFVIAELYGWTGTRNEGTCESVESKASKILAKERALGYDISTRIADSAIFSSKAHSISDDFAACGVYFSPCNKAPGTRSQSINMFRNLLIGSLEREERPGIFWFSTCHNHIATIPTLPRDKKNPDDVDGASEDHCLHGDTIVHTIEYGSVPIRTLVGKSGHCMTAGGYYAPFDNCKCYFRNSEMVEVTANDGTRMVCTPDHKVLVGDDFDYCEAQYLSNGDRAAKVTPPEDIDDGFLGYSAKTLLYGSETSRNGGHLLTKKLMDNPCKDSIVAMRSIDNVSKVENSDAYCLTVHGTHCFVVNDGFVVANCLDTILYLCLSEMQGGFVLADTGIY